MNMTNDPEFTGPSPKPAPVESQAAASPYRVPLLCFLGFYTAGSLGLHVLAWTLFASEWRPLHLYAETSCTVLDKGLKKVDPRGDVTRPEVQIRYSVGGRDYQVWTYNATPSLINGEEANRAALASFALGGTYPCWYDPVDPGRVVVARGHSWITWLLLGFTAALVLLGLGSFVVRWRPAPPPRPRPIPPEMVLVGSKPSPPGLETTPIECEDSSSIPMHVASCDDLDVFLIKPRRVFYRVVQGFLATGLTFLAVVGWAGILSTVGILLTALGIACTVIAGWLYHGLDTHRFDRRAGQYRRSVPLRRTAAFLRDLGARANDPDGGIVRSLYLFGCKAFEIVAIYFLDARRVERPPHIGPAPARRIPVIPLDSILAIQFLADVYHPSVDPGRAHDPNAGHLGNQINLVLADPEFPRQNLIDQGDREETARIARELAGFLGVPLYGRS
jgi:hypothetical protein